MKLSAINCISGALAAMLYATCANGDSQKVKTDKQNSKNYSNNVETHVQQAV